MVYQYLRYDSFQGQFRLSGNWTLDDTSLVKEATNIDANAGKTTDSKGTQIDWKGDVAAQVMAAFAAVGLLLCLGFLAFIAVMKDHNVIKKSSLTFCILMACFLISSRGV